MARGILQAVTVPVKKLQESRGLETSCSKLMQLSQCNCLLPLHERDGMSAPFDVFSSQRRCKQWHCLIFWAGPTATSLFYKGKCLAMPGYVCACRPICVKKQQMKSLVWFTILRASGNPVFQQGRVHAIRGD